MKFTRKGYGQLLRADGSRVSQHTVAEEAYERASAEGPGVYTWHPARVEIEVPAAAVPTPEPTPDPVPEPTPDPTPDPEPVPDPTPVPTPDPVPMPSGRLLQKADLRYLGAFQVPNTGDNPNTFEYGGYGLSINPGGGLFMVGLDVGQRVAEITVPGIGQRAVFRQQFADPVGGKLGQVGDRIGGTLVYNNRLIVTGYVDYDADNTQSKSHFARTVSLAGGSVVGPVALSGAPARWLSGYMAHVPQQWRAAFGGPALTGLSGVNIASAASNGPAVAAFDPVSLSAAKLLVGYTLDASLPTLYGSNFDRANPYWNFVSQVRGVAFPDDTDSVLFFGRHGLGAQQYGVDPKTGYKGFFAYPHVPYVWAYDAHDLAAVAAGSKKPGAVKPYAVWQLPIPSAGENAQIGGAAYDPATRRIYVSQIGGEGSLPLIHVFEV